MTLFEFTGRWSSDRYSRVCGTVEIELPHFYTDRFTTTLTLKYTGAFRTGETRSWELQGRFGKDHENVSRYVLMPVELANDQLFTLTFSQRGDTFKGYYSCVYPYDIGTMTIKCSVTCQGCLEMQANQLGHMDYGGCLYDGLDSPNSDTDDNDQPNDAMLAAIMNH